MALVDYLARSRSIARAFVLIRLGLGASTAFISLRNAGRRDLVQCRFQRGIDIAQRRDAKLAQR